MKIAIIVLLLGCAWAQNCGKGGLLCDQGSCHYPAYLEGCLSYAADDSCAACEYNYQLTNGKCLYAPNLQGADCCAQFNTSGACVACARGLYVNPNSGLCEDKKIEGCLLKTNGACTTCARDYDLVGSICVRAVAGCTAYDQYYTCIACTTAYTLRLGVCLPVFPAARIPNCERQNEYGCAVCSAGWTSLNGGCQPTPAGCLVVAANGDCQVCQSPYFQLQNGQCAVVGCLQLNGTACAQCNSALGFVLNSGVCSIPNCLYFSAAGCSLCQGGLLAGSWGCKKESESVCLICKINEFLGADGKCHAKNVHCTKYQGGLCIGCCEGYFLDTSSLCQLAQIGCIYSNGVCSSCSSPFTFANATCSIFGCLSFSAQGCASCDSRLVLINQICSIPNCQQLNGYTCAVCAAGFQLSSQGCVAADPNCLTRNSLNVCVSCKEGYQLDKNGGCFALKAGCNYVDSICTSCRSPFAYVPATQTCVIDGCLSYFIGGCRQCGSNYTLLYNSCKLPNCLTSSNGNCLECDPDFVFTSSGLCVSKDEFCDKMDAYGTCIKCLSNYYYSQLTKKCIKKAPGCNYDASGLCCSCNAPFAYEDGRCGILGCQTLTDLGCYACLYPFQLTPQNTCEIAHCNAYSNGKCVGCRQGFALSDSHLCLVQDANCLNYNTEQTQCLSCVKGYRFDENGRCEYADAHCWEFDGSGVCMNCDRIYFLNPHGRCQLRDPQCAVYTNGYCTQCAPYYYVSAGACMGNLKNCKRQDSPTACLECDSGYSLKLGACVAPMTQLTWNSVEMDFSEGDDAAEPVFTSEFTSTTNLVQAIASGATVTFSSSSLADAQFQVDSQGTSGWSPVGQAHGSYIGVKTSQLQTFYAVDIRVLLGSTLDKFTLEYSMDGTTFADIGSFQLAGVAVGSVKTFYFAPVYAQFIRIVAQSGIPNIKFEFYYSSGKVAAATNSSDNSYITKTLVSTLDTAYGGESSCGSNGLCWAGVEACEPRRLAGFSILYTNCSQADTIETVKIDYSMDGVTYSCWNNCQEVPLAANAFSFPAPLLAQKLHVHFSKYHGNPRFGIKFTWAN